MSDVIKPPSLSPHLNEKGYLIITNAITPDLTDQLVQQLKSNITTAAKNIGCGYDEYLNAVSRWVNPSPICKNVTKPIIKHLKPVLSKLTKGGKIVKENIISKTEFSPNPIPIHQDISYQTVPYQYSAWVALTDSPLDSGCLEVLPESHKSPIKPAVDFWVPGYKDTLRNSPRWKSHAVRIPVNAGDIIIFDSRLWHGSGYNDAKLERFAAVFRWTGSYYVPPRIPDLPIHEFGMWTCQAKTEAILRESGVVLFELKDGDFINLLDCWIEYLQQESLPFECDPKESIDILKKLRILHIAHGKHNGGEAQGSIYSSLWKALLKPLCSK